MAEEMATAQNRILLNELMMIEILSRVDTNNHLELRCVCKLWKSLVLDPYFMKNHILSSFTDLSSLWDKAMEQFNALKSRIKEEEEEKEHEEEVLDVDGAQEEEEEEVEEEEEQEEEEEDGDGGDVDAELEEEELKLNLLAELDKIMEKEKELKKKGKNLDNLDEKKMIIKVAKFDNALVFARYIKSFTLNFLESIKSVEDIMELKGNLESIRVEMKTIEDRYASISKALSGVISSFFHTAKAAKDSR